MQAVKATGAAADPEAEHGQRETYGQDDSDVEVDAQAGWSLFDTLAVEGPDALGDAGEARLEHAAAVAAVVTRVAGGEEVADTDGIAGSCWDGRNEPSAAGEAYTESEAAHLGP